MITKFQNTDFLETDEIKLVLEKTSGPVPELGWVPAYHFAICDKQRNRMGECDLRLGHNEKLYYGGNIGYCIDKPFRGHNYAAKSCLLLFSLAMLHKMKYLIITCDPDNIASRKTLERLGGELLEIVVLPEDNDMRIQDGSTEKCIFRFDL